MALLRNLRELAETAWKLATGRYPGFVYGRAVGADQIPVFTFHEADPGILEPIFQFLAENGYRTLSCDQAVEVLGGGRVPERCVQLTFDDGYASNWIALLPLLEKYDLSATIFLVTERMDASPGCRPRMDPTPTGEEARQEVLAQDRGAGRFLRWDEVRGLAASGRLDIQSHTHHHALVFDTPRLHGFVTPEFLATCRAWSFEWPWLEEGGQRLAPADDLLGTPLYVTRPRMEARPRLLPSPAARRACVAAVGSAGKGFFERAGWRRRLLAAHAEGLGQEGHRREGEADMIAMIRADLTTSLACLERELPGQGRFHLAWPWGLGSDQAAALAREAGFRSSYWVEVDGLRIPRAGMDPYRLPRLTWDFLLTLPGRGRVTLAEVIRNKFLRRRRHGVIYQTH